MGGPLFQLASNIVQLVLAVTLIWALYTIIARLLGFSSPRKAEPPADFAENPARLKPRPKAGAGAVAVAEPDEDD